MATDEKKGIYIARLDLAVPNHLGIRNKINGQLKVLSNTFGPLDAYFPHGLSIEKNDAQINTYPSGPFAFQRFHQFGFYNLLRAMNLQADYFYIRYQLGSFSFIKFLQHLRTTNPNAKIILELPTYPYDLELQGTRAKLKSIQDKWARKKLNAYVDRILTYSQEDEIFGVKTIQTANGIDVESVHTISPPPYDGQILKMVGVANVSPWHGYDRVIQGMKHYREQYKILPFFFDIIGNGVSLPELRNLVTQLNLGENVRFLGVKKSAELDQLLNSYHVAISSLGFHRIDGDTTTLKSREYCARGLPFISSHIESDINVEFPFIFYGSNDDIPINLADVKNFFDNIIATHPNYAGEMRHFAETTLTWDMKIAPLVNYIAETQDN